MRHFFLFSNTMKGLNVVVDFGIHGNVDFLPCLSPQDFYQLSYYAQCLKITKNVAFEKSPKSPKSAFLGIFNELLATQNVNVARFARNVECDFLSDFQTLCAYKSFQKIRKIDFQKKFIRLQNSILH